MRFEHPTGYIIAAVLMGAMVLGAGLVAGTVVVADASTDSDGAPQVPKDLTLAETPDDDDGSTITVSGTGSVSAQPDQAVVVVAATARAENASAATTELANQSSELRDALADAGVSDDAVNTVDFRVGQEERGNETAFVAQQTFEVTLNDTDAVGETIDLAVENGASEVHGVRFTVSDERAKELRATAIDRAVSDARQQADVVANSTNLTVSSVNDVNVGGGGSVSRVAEADAGGGGTEIDASPVSVSVNVEVTYNATPSGEESDGSDES